MNIKKIKDNITLLLISSMILWYFLPIFSFYFRSISLIIIFILFFTLNLSVLLKAFNENFPIIFILFIFLIFHSLYNFNSSLFNNNLLLVFWNSIYIVLPIFPFLYLINNHNKISTLYFIILFCTFYTAISTFFYLDIDPLASRNLSFVNSNNDAYFNNLMLNNVGGFEFIYFLPILTISFEKFKTYKFFPFFILLSFFYLFVVIKSQYTIAVLFQIFSIFYLLFFKFLDFSKFIFSFFISLFIIFLLRDFISSFVLLFSNFFESGIIRDRLIALSNILTGQFDINEESIRIDLYYEDFIVFLDNPIFGSIFQYKYTNNHSELISLLARFGVGYLMLLFYAFNKSLYYIKDKRLYKYLIFVSFLIGILNPVPFVLYTTFIGLILSKQL
jgi:hypothetical protein